MVLGKHGNTGIGRADLIYFLYNHEEKMEKMAKFAGYERLEKMATFAGYTRLEKQKSETKTIKERQQVYEDTEYNPEQPKIEHHFIQTTEKSKYWYADSYRAKRADEVSSERPDYADYEDIFKKGDTTGQNKDAPDTEPLVSWSKLWVFLKNALGSNRESNSIDIKAVVDLISRGRLVSKMPKIKKRVWAENCNIILDFSQRLVPFWDDMHAICNGIKKMRGCSGLNIYKIKHGPGGKFRKYYDPLVTVTDVVSDRQGPFFIISDLGCFESNHTVKQWICFGERLKRAQIHPIVLTPCLPKLWDNELLKYYCPIRWDRGNKLPVDLKRICKTYSGTASDEEAGYYLFSYEDIRENFVKKIANPIDKISSYLNIRLFKDGNTKNEFPQIIDRLNELLGTDELWNSISSKEIQLREKTKELIEEKPQSVEKRIQTNRYILEDCYPSEIKKRYTRTERLLNLLSPAIRVEPALLRAARLILPGKQADSGVEAAVWSHSHTERSLMAFIYKHEFIRECHQAFKEEPKELREEILQLIEKHHSHLPQAVRVEEKIIACTLQNDLKNAKDAIEFMEKYFRTVGDEKFSHDFIKAMKAWFYRFADRQHCEIWEKNKILTECWVRINYDLWKQGRLKLKQGMNPDHVAWMFEEKKFAVYTIFQLGNEFVIHNGMDRSGYPLGVPATKIATSRRYIDVTYIDDDKKEVSCCTFNLNSNFSTKIQIPLKGEFILSSDHEEIKIKSMEMPIWADSIEKNRDGFFVTLNKGQKLKWFNPGMYIGKDARRKIIKEKGFWGDAAGVDEYGLYVDLAVNGVNQRMRWIRPGAFMMGSPENERGRLSNEVLHKVILTQGFWLGETVCTQELWEAVMGNNPSRFKGKARPVERISWNDCREFIDKLNGIADLDFRFPTEAEWEYACRAGTSTSFSFGDNITVEQVNYRGTWEWSSEHKGKYGEQTVQVGSLPCNNWGLYEMHGNVWEWCNDWYDEISVNNVAKRDRSYANSTEIGCSSSSAGFTNLNDDDVCVIDPVGPNVGTARVLRGGSWSNGARLVRSASRSYIGPDYRFDYVGFRLARGHKSSGKTG